MGLEDFLGGLEDFVFVFVFLHFQDSNSSKSNWKFFPGPWELLKMGKTFITAMGDFKQSNINYFSSRRISV